MERELAAKRACYREKVLEVADGLCKELLTLAALHMLLDRIQKALGSLLDQFWRDDQLSADIRQQHFVDMLVKLLKRESRRFGIGIALLDDKLKLAEETALMLLFGIFNIAFEFKRFC